VASVDDGAGDSEVRRSTVEVEVAKCRANVDAGDLSHAAMHLGRALFHDPSADSVYAALGEVVEAAGSSEAARELFKGDGATVFPGNAAAIASLVAGEGRVSYAVELLGSVVAAHPELPWAAAPWFCPELADSLPLLSIGKAVASIWQSVDNPAPPETAAPLAPWLALARIAADRTGVDADCLCAFSALARRLEAFEDAIAWCRRAEEYEVRSDGRAKQLTLIMLGYACQDGGHPQQAIDVWKRAAALRPRNADLLLQLADATLDLDNPQQSLMWAERAATLDRTEVKYRAAVLAARYRLGGRALRVGRRTPRTGTGAQLTELVDLAMAHPEVRYLRNCVERACEGRIWLRTVPRPTDIVTQLHGELVEIEESGQERVGTSTSLAGSIEAPSAVAFHRARFPRSTITVPHQPGPDPRIPVRTDFGPPLWSYRGTEATATVPPPSPEAVDLVHQVAAGIWADPLIGYERAAAFTGLDSADLLGLLAHMPPPRDSTWVRVQRQFPLYWQRFAQVWVCLGILHHRPEEPWDRSTRRTLLLRLLYGPDDWTVDAAAFALCVAAWRSPEQRPEIADAVTQRYLHVARAARTRPTELHDPLARVVLICPGVEPKVVRRARRALEARRRQAARTDPEKAKAAALREWERRKNG
jgi:tetratricopeptide (TPR) repeat protein